MKIKCLFTFYHHHTLSSILNQEKEFNYSPYIYTHKHKPNTHTHKRSMRMEKKIFFFNRKKMNKIVICCCKPHHHQYKAQERIQDQRPTTTTTATTAEKNIYTMSILHRIYILKCMYVCGILLLYMR